jgi:tol-pal system protein YbgF
MLRAHSLRNRLLVVAVAAAVWGYAPVKAHAANKDIVELQTQVQQLMDAVQRLQSTVDAKFGLIQHLVEQTTDNANRVNASIDALQKKLESQSEAMSTKLDTASGQVQSLNDSVDELKSRMGKLDKAIQDLQSQLQNIQNPPATQPGLQPGTPGGPGATQQQPGSGTPNTAPAGPPQAQQTPQAPPLQETYQAGLRDFNTGRYQVAEGEFQDVLTYYPQDDLAGNAQFYLGEIAYQQKDYATAVKDYNAVLEGFSGSPKASAAQYHKGLALLQQGKRDAGIRELRALIQRRPQTPEATQARAKLNGMGVRVMAKQ